MLQLSLGTRPLKKLVKNQKLIYIMSRFKKTKQILKTRNKACWIYLAVLHCKGPSVNREQVQRRP